MKKFTVLSLVLAAVALFAGCSSVQPNPTPNPTPETNVVREFTPKQTQDLVANIVGGFARNRIRNHPNSVPAFQKARASLNYMVQHETWNLSAFADVLSDAGFTDGAGPDGSFYISSGIALIETFSGVKLDLSKVEYVRAIVVGGSIALNLAVPSPPSL